MYDEIINTPSRMSEREMLEDASSHGRNIDYDFTKPFFLSDENILDIHWYLFRKNTAIEKRFLRREKVITRPWEIVPVKILTCPECGSYYISRRHPFDIRGYTDKDFASDSLLVEGRKWSPMFMACDGLIFGTIFIGGGRGVGHRYLLECPKCQECTIENAATIARRIERGVNFTDNPPIDVKPHYPEWVKCPSCGLNFKYTSDWSFRDGRHWNCGQKLNIIDDL